jgi:hypothetical protein
MTLFRPIITQRFVVLSCLTTHAQCFFFVNDVAGLIKRHAPLRFLLTHRSHNIPQDLCFPKYLTQESHHDLLREFVYGFIDATISLRQIIENRRTNYKSV